MWRLVWLAIILLSRCDGRTVCSTCRTEVSTSFLGEIVKPRLLTLLLENEEGLSLTKTLGGAVRVGFHDAGTFTKADGTGRPNGCFLMDDPGNGGLDPLTIQLARLWADLPKRQGFSRADLFQYASLLAVEEAYHLLLNRGYPGEPDAVIPPLPPTTTKFRYGRIDAPDCAETGIVTGTTTSIEVEREKLPAPHSNFAEIKEIFVDRMGLTVDEMVALSGAHTLGSATRNGSGFDGEWVLDSAMLDNQYFVNLVERLYQRETLQDSEGNFKFQWMTSASDRLFMLNTDLSLVYQVQTFGGGCQNTNTCSKNNRGDQLTSRLMVETFAGGARPPYNRTSGLQTWYSAFIPALLKLGEVGYSDEELFEPCTLPVSCTEEVDPNVDLSKRVHGKFTILFEDKFDQDYHGSTGFADTVKESVAVAFNIDQLFVNVDSVRSGSVITDISVYLDPIREARHINVLKTSNKALRQALVEAFQSKVASNIVGPLKVVRVLSVQSSDGKLEATTSPQNFVDDSLLGPFQAESINQQATLIGSAVTAIVIVLLTGCLVMFSRGEDGKMEDIELQNQAREQRKMDRLSSLAPTPFSEKAFELSYAANFSSAYDDDDDGNSSSDTDQSSDGESRRHKKKKKKKHKHKKRSK